MHNASDPIEPGEEFIESDDVTERIGYLEFLDDETDPQTLDEWADEVEELHTLRELAAGLPDGVTLICETAWEEYSDEQVEDLYGIYKNGLSEYFDHDKYADDLQTDYSQVQFGDYTYYYLG